MDSTSLSRPGAALAPPVHPGSFQRSGRRPLTLRTTVSAPGRQLPRRRARATGDYAAAPSEADVLRKPLKAELRPAELVHVFGYPRDFEAHFQIGASLGAGSFGIVREAIDVRTGRRWAVKSIAKVPKSGHPTPRYLLKLQTEVDVMRQLGASLDAVHLKDVFEDDHSVHLVMELCEGGSVLEGLSQGDYSECQVQHVMRSVLRFLAQSHSKGIVYRDVKPDNFLAKDRDWAQDIRRDGFYEQGPSAGSASGSSGDEEIGVSAAGLSPRRSRRARASGVPHWASPVKATDFGLAIRHHALDPPLRSRSGTPAYMAPEVLQQAYSFPADVWSAGVMMYQLITGKFPFWDAVKDCSLQEVWTAILTQKVNFGRPELREVSTAARGLLMSLLERDPARRITAAKALEHPWLMETLAGGGRGAPRPLRASVVQRLQRFATHGRLKQLVLRLLAESLLECCPVVGEDVSDRDGSKMTGDGQQSTLPSSASASCSLPARSALNVPWLRDWIGSVQALFDELDVDSSGSLDVQELTDGLDRLGFDLSPGELEVLMGRLDVNHDGGLQLWEFVASLVDWGFLQRLPDWRAWVRTVFDRLDADGNGAIDLEELEREARRSLGADESASESLAAARLMLREADANNDGQVSWEEFLELLDGAEDDLYQYDPRLRQYNEDEDDPADIQAGMDLHAEVRRQEDAVQKS